jgi:hypothetical protein
VGRCVISSKRTSSHRQDWPSPLTFHERKETCCAITKNKATPWEHKGVFGRVYQDGLVRWPWHGRLESGSNGTGARVWQLGPGARPHRDRVWQLLVQIVFGSVGPVCHTCLHLHPHTPWIQPATSFSRRPSSSPPAGHSTRVRAATFSRPRARAPSVTCRSRRGPVDG